MDREFEEYENAIIAQSVSAEAASYARYLARACKEARAPSRARTDPAHIELARASRAV